MSRKSLFVWSLLLLTAQVSFAQKFYIGIKGGLSHTGIIGNFQYKEFRETEIKYNQDSVSSGLIKKNLGAIFIYQPNNHLFFTSELNYEEKGFDFNCTHHKKKVAGYYTMKYASVPLTIACEGGNYLKYYGYCGVCFDLLMNGQKYMTYTNKNVPSPVSSSAKYIANELNKKELDFVSGVGIKIPFNNRIYSLIDLRYSFGLTKAAHNTDEGIYHFEEMLLSDKLNNFQNVFNRTISLTWGVVLPLGKEKVQTKKTENHD